MTHPMDIMVLHSANDNRQMKGSLYRVVMMIRVGATFYWVLSPG